MYRNAAYSPEKRQIHIYTWNEDGDRVEYVEKCYPYFYTEHPQGDEKSIFDTRITKRTFTKQYERQKYIADNGLVRLYENLPAIQQHLLDKYWEDNESDDFTRFPLKVYFFDIETYSPNGFPNINDPRHPINVITVYNSLDNKFYTWGLEPFERDGVEGTDHIPKDNVVYTYCETEEELLKEFLDWFSKDYPDILSGYNSELFDIPYIIGRIKLLLGEDEARRLSPIRSMYSREIKTDFGFKNRWFIEGISCIDYLDVYKRFRYINRPSYKLDYIAEAELGANKLDFGDMDLATLSKKDWNRFVLYNIHDVNLLVLLDEKLNFISLLRMLAYAGLTTFELAMGTVNIVNGAAAIRARQMGKRVQTFVRRPTGEKNPGAYVGIPEPGFQDYIVSFDATSLYPTVMLSLNLSPETKVGWIEKATDEEIIVQHVSGKTFNFTKENFAKFINTEKIAITKANVLFTQKQRGIIPALVEEYFNRRKPVKRLLIEKENEYERCNDPDKKKKLRAEIDRLNAKQLCIKVFINSVYGYFGNKFAPMGDDDIASSITLTGQAVIKQSNKLAVEYINKVVGKDIEPRDVIIYNDTDSVYITIKPLIDNGIIEKFADEDLNVTEEVYTEVENLANYINKHIAVWGKRVLNSLDCRFNFKREALALSGLFFNAKKRYVLHILDDEGVKMNKYKYVGVELVRTTMPESIKAHLKDMVEVMISTKSKNKTDDIFNKVYETFMNMSIEDISLTSGIKHYDKYAKDSSKFNVPKGTPIHVKSAIYYNELLKQLNIESKYEKIQSGDKMKFVYVQPNKFGIKSVGFKYEWPTEFDQVLKPDYEAVFDRAVFSMTERFYQVAGWSARKPNDQLDIDLSEMFGS